MKTNNGLKTSISTIALLTALGLSGALEAADWNDNSTTEENRVHEMTDNTSPIHTGKRSQEYEAEEEAYSNTYEQDDHMREEMTDQKHLHPDSETDAIRRDEKYSNNYSTSDLNMDRNMKDSVAAEFDSSGEMNQELFFKFDSTELTDESSEKLSNIVETLEEQKTNNVEIEVVGYTDNSGPDVYNDHLSKERAKAVKEKLSSELDDLNVADWKIEGKGESNPLADNGTRQGRMENRRVQVIISKNPNDRVSQSDF